MKRFALGITLSLALVASVFAQSGDMTPLAVVKLNKTETITLKQLKTRVELTEKQLGQKTTVDQRKQILDSLIQEKLILQAATKQGVAITDSQVDQYFLSSLLQGVGATQQMTEAQFSDQIKKQTGKTLNEYLIATTGMGIKESKEYIKNSLITNYYIQSLKQAEVAKISASDSEIRSFFDMNRSQFVWNDSAKVFFVSVPKDKDSASAMALIKDLRNQYIKDKTKDTAIVNSADNGKKYLATYTLALKTAAYAQSNGWTEAMLNELFGKSEGFVSEISDEQTLYQFYVVQKKYSAKMLGISDIVVPESNVTVYEYIKSGLTQQKQMAFLQQALIDLVKSLDTPANVERKKTGDALNALLKW